jgi:hypothetical protein
MTENTENVYVNTNLHATKHNLLPKADYEVARYVDELAMLVDLDELLPIEAYDLIVNLGKLKRVRPEMLDDHALQIIKEVEARLAQHGHDLAEMALSVLHPPGWLDEAREFESSYEDMVAEVERIEWAAELITDLDDAQVFIVMARRLGIEERAVEPIEHQLDECEEWLLNHVDEFLPASMAIQIMGQTLRPDLGEVDYDLAATASKFPLLLIELEQIEDELNGRRLPRLPESVIAKLRSEFERERHLSVPEIDARRRLQRYRSEMESRAFAAAAAPTQSTPPTVIRWWSPDGSAFARVVLPEQGSLDQRVRVAFLRQSDMSLLADRAGRRVKIGDTVLTISEQGDAELALRDLLECESPERLRWVDTGEIWAPKNEN